MSEYNERVDKRGEEPLRTIQGHRTPTEIHCIVSDEKFRFTACNMLMVKAPWDKEGTPVLFIVVNPYVMFKTCVKGAALVAVAFVAGMIWGRRDA